MGASSDRTPGARLGEVIETSTVRLWVESDHLHELPPLGSVVRVASGGGDIVFAIVAFGQTGGIDATRRAIRRGSNELRDDAVYRRHPELAQILRTTFEVLPVAYRRGSVIRRMLPPLPPPLHYSVESVEQAELRHLTDDPRYLSLLVSAEAAVPVDQLLAAHLRQVYEQRGNDRDWLDLAAREIARLLKDDYDRVVPILEAVDPDT